jgi:hypothetical protein
MDDNLAKILLALLGVLNTIAVSYFGHRTLSNSIEQNHTGNNRAQIKQPGSDVRPT